MKREKSFKGTHNSRVSIFVLFWVGWMWILLCTPAFGQDPDPEIKDEDSENIEKAPLSELMSDVSSPVVMSGLLVGRTPEARHAAEEVYGKGLEKYSEPAVSQALRWLREHQQIDGSWNAMGTAEGESSVICTGLALLTLISHGETSFSAEYGTTVSKALQYLVGHQDEQGVFRPVDADPVTGQAVAIYALAEAYIMTENSVLQEPLKRGVKALFKQMDESKGKRGPLSGAWQVQALSSASWAVRGDPEVRKRVQQAVDEMLLSVDPRGNLEGSENFVASKALSLCLARRYKSEAFGESLDLLENFTWPDSLPQWGSSKVDAEPGGEVLFWYLAVNAFFCEDPDGENFRRFMPALIKALVQNQVEDGHWDDYTEAGKRLGPVTNTSLAALSLMVYYQSYHVNPVYVPQAGEWEEALEPEQAEFDLN